MNTLVINYQTREKRFALLKNKEVEKLVIDQPKLQSSVGNIYLGRVEKVMPGLNAAFVEIGEGKSGFLHRDKLASFVNSSEEKAVKDKKSISSFVHQGEKFLVQVEKDATGTKGPRLTGIVELQGNHLIYMPDGRYVAVSKKLEDSRIREKWRQFGYNVKEEKEGLIFRTSCEDQTIEALKSELERLRKDYNKVLKKAESLKKPGKVLEGDSFVSEVLDEIKKMETGEVVVDDLDLKTLIQNSSNLPVRLYSGKENIFSSYRLESEIDKALKRIVWLENGAYLIFDEAEALTVIDVNTGKYSGKHDLRNTVIKTNELAAAETARQIRLRDIAGMVLIDFIDMKEERDRKYILQKMDDELKKDERRTNLIGFTPLGILQLTRKKTKTSISETLAVKCPVCEGTGRVLSTETVAFRLERDLWEHRYGDYEAVLISASDDVIKIFSGEQDIYKNKIVEMTGLEILFLAEKSDKPFYEIRQFGNAEDLKRKFY